MERLTWRRSTFKMWSFDGRTSTFQVNRCTRPWLDFFTRCSTFTMSLFEGQTLTFDFRLSSILESSTSVEPACCAARRLWLRAASTATQASTFNFWLHRWVFDCVIKSKSRFWKIIWNIEKKLLQKPNNKNCLGSFQVLWNKNCTTENEEIMMEKLI